MNTNQIAESNLAKENGAMLVFAGMKKGFNKHFGLVVTVICLVTVGFGGCTKQPVQQEEEVVNKNDKGDEENLGGTAAQGGIYTAGEVDLRVCLDETLGNCKFSCPAKSVCEQVEGVTTADECICMPEDFSDNYFMKSNWKDLLATDPDQTVYVGVVFYEYIPITEELDELEKEKESIEVTFITTLAGIRNWGGHYIITRVDYEGGVYERLGKKIKETVAEVRRTEDPSHTAVLNTFDDIEQSYDERNMSTHGIVFTSDAKTAVQYMKSNADLFRGFAFSTETNNIGWGMPPPDADLSMLRIGEELQQQIEEESK